MSFRPACRTRSEDKEDTAWFKNAGQGGPPILPLDGDRAQVEQHERIGGPFGQFSFKDLAIVLEFALSAPGR